jgi:hypothetical protein
MVGLGVLNDQPPPNSPQPQLEDGIHLRWAFKPEKGFPLYGYYLFRRLHKKGQPIYLQNVISTPTVSTKNIISFAQGQIISDKPLKLTDDFPFPGGDGIKEFDLSHREAINIQFAPDKIVRWVEVQIGFRANTEITVTAYMQKNVSPGFFLSFLSEHVQVVEKKVKGIKNQIVKVILEFDAISAIKLSNGAAALVNLGFVPVSQDAELDWEPVPHFPYPMCLPVIHPDYPCTQGNNEDLEAARLIANNRILYGKPSDYFTSPQPLLYQTGVISVENGSPIIKGSATDWNEDLIGETIKVQGDATAYTIMNVINPQRLVLSRKYTGTSRTNVSYSIHQDEFAQLHDNLVHLVSGSLTSTTKMHKRTIPPTIYSTGKVAVIHDSTLVIGINTNWNEDLVDLTFRVENDKQDYTILNVISTNQLRLNRAYHGNTSFPFPKNYTIFSALLAGETESPKLPQQYPLHLVLLSALHPAIAQMIGLYWVDRTAEQDKSYDYLILADNQGFWKRYWGADLTSAFNALQDLGLEVDGYIVFNKKKEQAIPLNPPVDACVYALPGSFSFGTSENPIDVDAQNNAGLCWNLGITNCGIVTPGGAIMYHVWRVKIPDQVPLYTFTPTDVPETHEYELLTGNNPVLVSNWKSPKGKEPQNPPDWPPFRLYYIDSRLTDGWYSYKLSGIDIFGRHSHTSSPAKWHQWEPKPDPIPWYFKENQPGNSIIHPFAVHLLDKIPPPPPTGIEAYALDPLDPYVLKDDSYDTWRNKEENKEALGLRVSWLWTPAHMQQAPDTREFRIYYQPQQMNSISGRTLTVTNISITESLVETDIPNSKQANAYVGTTLRIGSDSFQVVGSEATSPLRLRVNKDPIYEQGTITVENGSTTVIGSGTQWGSNLCGFKLWVSADVANAPTLPSLSEEQNAYTILKVDSNEKLVLHRSYTEQSGSGKKYTIFRRLPRENKTCNLVKPSVYNAGSIMVINGSNGVEGEKTGWRSELIGRIFQVSGEATKYTVNSVDSDSKLRLDRGYEGISGKNKAYKITHPLSMDFTNPRSWKERIHVVDYSQNVTETLRIEQDSNGKYLNGDNATVAGSVVSLQQDSPDLSGIPTNSESPFQASIFLKEDVNKPTKIYRILHANNDPNSKAITVEGLPNIIGPLSAWIIGLPVRKYEVFLQAPQGELAPSLNEPIVYGYVGVSAADKREHTHDDPKWTLGDWGGSDRFGNEGRVGAPAKIFCLNRIPPVPPVPPPDSPKVFATPADYHGHSYYTYRWPKPPANVPLKAHIFRSLDDTLFAVDWQVPERNQLNPNDLVDRELFPKDWELLRCISVAEELNNLNSLKSNNTDKKTAMTQYRELSNDALRVLAGLPGNEKAFTQITIQPLDPNDQNNANRPGPDNPDPLPDPLADPNLCIYIDTLDGRSTNRYFYRSAYLDNVNNTSKMSLSSPPVWLPNVVPPRAPVITKVLGGDQEIIIKWASNRESDLKEYWVYRTQNQENTRDLRLMDLFHKKTVPSTDPANRPPEVEWIDKPVQGMINFYYRIVAVDDADNVSKPSRLITAQAFDTSPPDQPTWHKAEWVKLDNNDKVHPWNVEISPYIPAVELRWFVEKPGVKCLLQRKTEETDIWLSISKWLDSGVYDEVNQNWAWLYYDKTVTEVESYLYRIKLVNSSGKMIFSNEAKLGEE